MTDEELYGHLSTLLQSMPDLSQYRANKVECDKWLAKAYAVVEAAGNIPDVALFRTSYERFATSNRLFLQLAAETVTNIVLRNHASLELRIAPGKAGGFIAVGNQLDAYTAITKVLSSAKNRIVIVDPYMDDKIITELLLTVPEGVPIYVLSDEAYCKPEFSVASKKWIGQYGNKRPLEARLTTKGKLHDRLILLDDAYAWVVSQSFKDIAKRSPASIVESDKDTAMLKVAAYNDIWNDAKPI